ncbi:DUF5666 domain-containing protein [Leptothrix discophora]|uniref:DUF5666 domain-containing protein n=1 Tax=Leptothrix discophora TaxID=89 RepID=A0ABT9G0J7_LEPDI|nr:DUF5666 domain-containing protein [Leptothrix discophora]MDP4300004.1 DUF5666 domain-containing protein [Leptothrix discophora]
MSHVPQLPASRGRSFALTGIAVATSLVLVACGGGASNGTGASASGSTAAGTISGFGSVITNGVRYELNGTTLVDESTGTTTTCSDNLGNCGLKMGMEVEIEADDVRRSSDGSTPSADAKAIHVGSSILGPVTSVAADGNSIVVLGQSIALTTNTRFEGGIQPVAGQVVEVHGLLDRSVTPVRLSASLVEVKSGPVSSYRLRGRFDKAAGTIGGEPMSFATLTGEDLARYAAAIDGQVVRVKLSTTAATDGRWVVTAFKSGERRYGSADHGKHSEQEGFVESVTTATPAGATAPVVTGLVVNGNAITVPAGFLGLEGGSLDQLVVGARVEVEGQVLDGALVASKIEFKKARKRSERGADDASQSQEFEMHGTLALGTQPNTLVVRGLTFDHSDEAAIRLPAGVTLADVLTWAEQGKFVEIKGYLMADGYTYKLKSIKLDSRPTTPAQAASGAAASGSAT